MWFTILTSFSNSSVWVWTFCQIFLVLSPFLNIAVILCIVGQEEVMSADLLLIVVQTHSQTHSKLGHQVLCADWECTHLPRLENPSTSTCMEPVMQEEIEIQVKVFETVTTKVEMFPFLSVVHSASRNWIQMWIQRSSRRWLPILPVSFSCTFLLLDKMLDTECPILLPVATVNTSNLKV